MTKLFRVCTMAFLLAALLVDSLLAQGRPPGFQGPPNQQGPPGSRPPRGPVGGGIRPQSAAAMLLIPEVQRELQLSEEQIALAQELRREWDAALEEAMIGMREPGQSREQMGEMFARMRNDLADENRQAEERIAAAMDDDQQQRFKQLVLQRGGPEVLLREGVAARLKLTEEQMAAIRDLAAGGFGPGSPRIVDDPKREALARLSETQNSAWQDLIGARFQFPQDRGAQQGRGNGRGRGFGRGGPNREERKLVDQFDANGDGWLNTEERQAAREAAADSPQTGRGGGRRGRGGFGRGNREPGTPGPKVSPADVEPVTDASLYEHSALRTLFLEFESTDWEEELEAFNGTDVEVPATLTVDGQTLENVGVHFRGMSSYFSVPRGSKRSFNVKVDFVNEDQRLYGYKTLNLLNLNGDASFLSSILYSHIARQYIAAPKANLVKVVVNGESWGIYANVQQFDKVFIKENFDMSGTRWKVQGSPGGRGGLEYLGDDVEDYKRIYTMKSNDGEAAWTSLINLCRVLNETPSEDLVAALEPLMDIDQVLWFLALDNASANSDGFWTRASDYYLFLGEDGKFRLIPHDMNEAFREGGRGGGRGRGPEGRGGPEAGRGRGQDQRGGDARRGNDERRDLSQGPGQTQGRRGGFGPAGGGTQRGGRGGGGAKLDPFVAADDPAKALCYRLFAVPEFRKKYLKNIQQIAEVSMDWKQLQPFIEDYRQLVDAEIKADTRKLSSYDAFVAALADNNGDQGPTGLKAFFEQRREFLLNYRDSSPGN